MSKASGLLRVCFTLAALGSARCAGDDTVNPVPLPEAGAPDAAKDANADRSFQDATTGEADPNAGATDAAVTDGSATSDASTDAGRDAAM